MSLFEIINVILPLYLLIGLGFVSIWWGWFPAAAIPGFGKFVRNFALPSAIFLALAQREMDEVLHLGFLLAFGIASVASFLLSLFFARRVGGNAPELIGLLALAGSMSNGLMIGIPLITGLFGNAALAAIAQQLIIENALLLPAGLVLVELARARAGQGRGTDPEARLIPVLRRTICGVLTNPMVLALLLGMLVSLSDWPLPNALERSVGMVAASVSGMALMFIGVTLFGTDLRATLGGVLPAIAIKNGFHPLMMALTFWAVMLAWKAMGWMPIPSLYVNTALVIASLPTIGTLPAIAAGFGQGRTISLAVLVMTLVSGITTPLTIWLLVTFQPFA